MNQYGDPILTHKTQAYVTFSTIQSNAMTKAELKWTTKLCNFTALRWRGEKLQTLPLNGTIWKR